MLFDVFAAIVGLIGAIIGGILVVIGDGLGRRSERRASRLDQLRLAAADVIASYLKARSHLIACRRAGGGLDRSELYPPDRQLALARLFTLPGSESLRGDVLALANATAELIDADGDEAFERCADLQLGTIRAMESAVRTLVGRH